VSKLIEIFCEPRKVKINENHWKNEFMHSGHFHLEATRCLISLELKHQLGVYKGTLKTIVQSGLVFIYIKSRLC
jgi:hypothetical protein